MIIPEATAKELIKAGKASVEGTTTDDGDTYVILTRHDIQRTDHYQGALPLVNRLNMMAVNPDYSHPGRAGVIPANADHRVTVAMVTQHLRDEGVEFDPDEIATIADLLSDFNSASPEPAAKYFWFD